MLQIAYIQLFSGVLLRLTGQEIKTFKTRAERKLITIESEISTKETKCNCNQIQTPFRCLSIGHNLDGLLIYVNYKCIADYDFYLNLIKMIQNYRNSQCQSASEAGACKAEIDRIRNANVNKDCPTTAMTCNPFNANCELQSNAYKSCSLTSGYCYPDTLGCHPSLQKSGTSFCAPTCSSDNDSQLRSKGTCKLLPGKGTIKVCKLSKVSPSCSALSTCESELACNKYSFTCEPPQRLGKSLLAVATYGCKDLSIDCPILAPLCNQSPPFEYVEENCPATCGCPTTLGPCFDEIENCFLIDKVCLEPKHESNSSTKMTNIVTKAPTVASTKIANIVTDKPIAAPTKIPNVVTDEPIVDSTRIPDVVTDDPCVDTLNPNDCDHFLNYCRDPAFGPFMREQCKRTCGFC
uniref:ShKT domain-containing protein n=1 Tax=Rhabditophanes sp. KR3021 TaxID=114890 RepID=A0AC35UAM0_9BILA